MNAAVVFVAVFFVTVSVYAATTISADIDTGAITATSVTSTGNVAGATGTFSNAATSTNYFIAGDPVINSLGLLTGGDTAIGGALEVDGSVYLNGSTIDFGTSTATTTAGLFVHPGTGASIATTTVSIGQTSDTGQPVVAGCLELVRSADNPLIYHCYIDDAGTGLVCAAGRCTD